MKIIRLFIVLVLVPVMSVAETVSSRQTDMTIVLHSDRGAPIKDPSDVTAEDKECAHCRDLTLGHAVAAALNGAYDDEKGLSFQQRFDRAALANRIKDSKSAELTAAEVALIERLIAKAGFFPSVVYQIAPLIDPNIKAGPAQ